jgi:hypothetical protein
LPVQHSSSVVHAVPVAVQLPATFLLSPHAAIAMTHNPIQIARMVAS